ncbi:MAG: cupredoxin domain-containing protein [Candidatus Eisenbacteria bacterium]
MSRPRTPARRGPALAAGIVPAVLLAWGCSQPTAMDTSRPYVPRTREITLTTVPMLVHEQEKVFPFLHQAFAKGGVLEDREVYAFVPGTITAVEGDTLQLSVVNPEDDLHTLVMPGLVLALPGGRTTHATYVAPPAGIYPFTCNVPTHMPMMWGQLVVLAPGAIGHPGPRPPRRERR